MKKSVANDINKLMLEFSKKLNESIKNVMDNAEPAEFESYRDAASKIMGIMLLDIMNPIYLEHPDLKPKELE